MKNYIYQNELIGKKQLRHLLAWSFTNYNSMHACSLADELKYLGFQYASQAGISINVEDLKIPFVKTIMLEKANQEIITAEKIYSKGRLTKVERFQKIMDTWSLTSESLKNQIIYYFKNYDPLNSVYIMAFSGARGNLSQVRQLVGMRGLMSDPNGEIMNLPIKKNFREGLTITDYLMSGYGARKGIVDTALKTANSGYLTRRLIDVSQDILIREKDCFTNYSIVSTTAVNDHSKIDFDSILGRILSKPIFDPQNHVLIAKKNTEITSVLIETCKKKKVQKIYFRSPLTCDLYRSVCQKCYGWDLANENIVDIGEAIGILAGQSIGEPGTQLTMRTFHTGGIFTSETREQLISPTNGVIQFYKALKTIVLRTNRGEDVLITKNSGSIILIPQNEKTKFFQLNISRNTILFPKNNQYILKDTVIGESINTNRQIKVEIKPILSDTAGEIVIPTLKKKIGVINNNKLIWILSGQLYTSPNNSFLNFNSDYKLTRYSYIFRTKINNHYNGKIEKLNFQKNIYQGSVQIYNSVYSFSNANLNVVKFPTKRITHLLHFDDCKYLLKLSQNRFKHSLKLTQYKQIGFVASNLFQTLTGGTLYYDRQNFLWEGPKNKIISYFPQLFGSVQNEFPVVFKTMYWLEEEFHAVNCQQNNLLVDHDDFISKGFELISNVFSKTAGRVVVKKKRNKVKVISIESGVIYEGKNFRNIANKLYYPGEIICANITAKTISLCENIIGKKIDQLLVRPIKLYEFSYSESNHLVNMKLDSPFECNYLQTQLCQSGQTIKGTKNVNLVLNCLILEKIGDPHINTSRFFELTIDPHKNVVNLQMSEKLYLNNYIVPGLKKKNIQPCFLIQKNQFISNYTTLGYLEAVNYRSLEVVKFKTQNYESKQILLISNKDCFCIKKNKFPTKSVYDFVTTTEMGKIIVDNGEFFTIQRGRPYFFPNCKNENVISTSQLQYKLLPLSSFKMKFMKNKRVSINWFDITRFSIRKQITNVSTWDFLPKMRITFPKLFFKSNGRLYNSLIPRFFKHFAINKIQKKQEFQLFFGPTKFAKLNLKKRNLRNRVLILKRLEKKKNNNKDFKNVDHQLISLKFVDQTFSKSMRAIGIYAITEDYFEQELNDVFCQNGEFIEIGTTIGLLNLEKEITGDIVQGLPRIEEILEARKKNIIIKKIPTSQKRGLLTQKNNLDANFDFRKLGLPIRENDKTNPHKLLKVYFNYYGLKKMFFCAKTKSIKLSRLVNNYEGSYKSFKQVQLFILNSVQSVYKSQGVTINDKHLEIIIKQMTTKVSITYEGNTPLLKREVVDLQHMEYINHVVETHFKEQAYYVPLLLGITKAALNNPSFISAASFQETTRVLTKAAIEGRMDWLRGLKENIIIGHLIPAGTGSQNYRNGFQKKTAINHVFDSKIKTKFMKTKV